LEKERQRQRKEQKELRNKLLNTSEMFTPTHKNQSDDDSLFHSPLALHKQASDKPISKFEVDKSKKEEPKKQ
jgi:hypothetical protein